MKAILVATTLIFLAGSAARADEKIDCKSQSLNQMELDQCAGGDFTASDTKLNALYKSMMAKYDSPDQAKLKIAEKAWLTYRDAECNYETNGTAGGTINSMEVTVCRTSKTQTRIKELNAQRDCEEGDLLCNAPTK